ncbi:MAG: hypothetical protein CO060_03705 [Candidatus Yonathbacteria bacterium CG_4_9_14_0_2_um_filter_43_16]|uniref:histidine kinase n=1 Tax=Candidatus Yonathbacteria bacterium CG_4_10_14_0_8_um_filter_43_17 TaxID=1975099 RepID=A0A2M7Q5J0_9BACT|nr:MAG: hypothetical protein COW60_02015 [Candidatus Yonathbacteria bacterium CG17_big_fil_post_rev_8_21_14_2_50_43_9]PIX57253.1 MAG: hypothetical protein COZ48_01830 [Candidatus Yonathbacteria bacterium CG_4_10_14_3_um_filter_43_12]PIY58352.1 MAG: hypothetical protein COY98_02950 [Candidatus Yonathbacteria bacterium CG_4_10_14_0_8_um_filter_43_17]PJC21514.1 MAG: hypothetical protein CO060_03705 [Candidatus Yonathbacteria bacterium CG_4_9_14_0_2_um_filter_43_16]
MNLFYTSSIILAFTSFLLGLMVYLKDRKNNLSKQWFIFSIFLAGWAISLYLVASAKSATTAFNWQYLLDIVALWVPVGYFNFITTLLNIKTPRLPWVISGIAVILSFFSLTHFFKLGVVQKFDFYWINPGQYYFVFPLFFTLVVLYSLFLLIRVYRKEQKGSVLRSQIRYQIIAGAIGFSGGATNFLPQLFNIFPFGNYFVIIYIFFISYSILKYHLFNLKLILVELAILLLNLFLFLNVFTSHEKTDLILNVSVSVFILAFSAVLIRGIYKDIRDKERIEGLVKDMEVANEKLRMLEGQKTEFVSIASHQLRTPLTVIKGYASMILEGTFGHINDQARDAMEKLYKSSERIVALVEDLLTVSRIEQGRMMLNFETINFKDLVQGVIDEMENEISESKIDLSFTAEEEKEFFVSIDEKKFKQVVKHILENAIKYTPAPGSVRVAVLDDSLTKKVRLTVSDTGIGMTREQITSIFERFNLKLEVGGHATFDEKHQTPEEDERREKEEAETAEEKMMEKRTPGIGLYIVQEIVEAHHGTLRIESAGTDLGTTVVVELPKGE